MNDPNVCTIFFTVPSLKSLEANFKGFSSRMAAVKKTLPISRLRLPRSRKNEWTDSCKPHSKYSSEISSSIQNRFPPNFTVDDLALFARKKITGKQVRDNLRPLSGKFSDLKSEYKHKFITFLIPPGGSNRFWRRKNTKIIENDTNCNANESGEIMDESGIEEESESKSEARTDHKEKYVMNKEARRAMLTRRPTNLKVEGEFTDTTEYNEKFKEYPNSHPPKMLRKGTTLKVEGPMILETEIRDKFKEHKNTQRSTLARRHSNIELPSTTETTIDTLSEYTDAFHLPENFERPALVRSLESLHLEGQMEFKPEYKQNFIHHTNHPDIIFKSRKKDSRPNGSLTKCQVKEIILDENLKTDFERAYKNAILPHQLQKTEQKRPRTHLIPPMGIGEDISWEHETYRPLPVTPFTKGLRPSTHLHARGKMDFIPEYKTSYVNLYENRGSSSPHRKSKAFDVMDKNKIEEDSKEKKNRSAEVQLHKGKRLPRDFNSTSGSECTNKQKPSFRLQVNNPDQVHKPFERTKLQEKSFLVLNENNYKLTNRKDTNNNWRKEKKHQYSRANI